MKRVIGQGSDHLVAGPLFDLVSDTDESFMAAAYCGSRIDVIHFDSAPHMNCPVYYEAESQFDGRGGDQVQRERFFYT